MKKIKLYVFCICVGVCGLSSKMKAASLYELSIFSEQDTSKYRPKDDFSLSAFPVVFYLPETGFSFGGLGVVVFNVGKKKKWRKSQVQLGAAYTLKNQLLIFAPYETYLSDKWKLNGELGYYRYFYNFYGIGIHSKEENLEYYDANFPRAITNLSYRFSENLFVGFLSRFDYFNIPNTDSLLQFQNPVGANGGVYNSIGTNLIYDSRDDVFFPGSGWYIDFAVENSGKHTLSDFTYSLVRLDARKYFTLAENHIIATNVYTGTTFNESPFFSYYYLASGKQGRGIANRRYIDKNIMLFQSEYRFPIYKRFSAVAFASAGTVASSYNELFGNPYKFAYGAGLRYQLSKKQKNNVRVDVARSSEGINFYFTIGEAF